MARKKKKIAVFDFETDPFLHNRVPEPFSAGFFDGETYKEFWGDDSADKLVDYLMMLPNELLIYAHNGGKFDFYYLLKFKIIHSPKIISARIVEAKLGHHTIRDSYAILPIPLAAWKKDEIDYTKLERGKREKHKAEILSYQKSDCVYLYDLINQFTNRFGNQLTIGGTALKELKKLHPFAKTTKSHDERFRPFYFGGRVQCFSYGVHKGAYKIFDVNSMYPFVMRNYAHPTGNLYTQTNSLEYALKKRVFLAHIECDQNNAFPTRTKDGLEYNDESGEFFVTSHELRVAMQYNLVSNIRLKIAHIPMATISFREYVDKYSIEKIEAKLEGRKADEIFAKLLLNSAYGKFGQNPENFYDWLIRYPDDDPVPDLEEWELYMRAPWVEIWRSPANVENYNDVATAASITGAARAVLLDALQNADKPLYCDTDSIICKSLAKPQHDSRLGAWKLEQDCTEVRIAGKKLYECLYKKEYVKIASKGFRCNPGDILKLINGTKIVYKKDSPTFTLGGDAKFITRTIARRY